MIQALFFSAIALLAADSEPSAQMVIVVGAAGTEDFGKQFAEWADRWQAAAGEANVDVIRIGDGATGVGDDREILQSTVAAMAGSDPRPLWLILIGHGTFDGRQAKFNLRGPDVAAAELAEWLKPLEQPLAIVNCASASGPFINHLSAPGRVVVTATKSGQEQFFARFGDYLSAALTDPTADLDKDDQVSLLEAFLAGSRRTDEFYERAARLATEHALIDDNGDGFGTRAEWFRGVRAVRRATDGAELDGLRAHQWHLVPSDRERDLSPEMRDQRQRLELAVERLRAEKSKLDENEYLGRLEAVMLELARFYERLDDDFARN